jgi:hypothetical protein
MRRIAPCGVGGVFEVAPAVWNVASRADSRPLILY